MSDMRQETPTGKNDMERIMGQEHFYRNSDTRRTSAGIASGIGLRFGFLLLLTALAIVAGAIDVGAQTANFVTISERNLSFQTSCGDSLCIAISIESTGLDTIRLLDGAVPTTPGFTLDAPDATTSFPLVILPSDTLTFLYCFRPTTPGTTINDLLVLQFDTLAGALPALDTIRLSGESLSPSLSINPAVIDFGNVTIGQISCRMVDITNEGNQAIDLALIDSLTFPFSPEGLPNVTLEPGQTIQVEVCFSPIVAEDFASRLSLFNGPCRDSATLRVSGRGLPVTANIGPVLQIIVPNFDTIRCGTLECRSLVFRNVGTDPLNITSLDDLELPFSGTFATLPIVIAPNDERTFTVCYGPEEAGRIDSALLNLVADNRVSLSIATLFDVSGSMRTDFGGTDRITAANDAGRSFLANLVNDPGRNVLDEGAVFQFGQQVDISLLSGFSSNIPALQAAVPSVATAPETCLFEGILFTVNSLATRNQPGRRVLIVLADGANSCNGSAATLQQAITAAQSAGVRIYTIGIGAADASDLTALATQTGGFYSEALSPTELLESYQTIANSLSRDQQNVIRLRGSSVAPLLSLSSTNFNFGEVRVGEEECRTLTLTNEGDALLENVTLDLPPDHYRLTPNVVPTILPGQSVSMEICFRPGTIRTLDRTIGFTYTRCDEQSLGVELQGVGFDSVTIAIDGSFTARPGSTVGVPIRLLDNVPESYGVDSLRVTLGYNKTMLFPADETTPYPPSGAILDPFATQDLEMTFGPNDVESEVAFNNGRLVNTSGPRPLGTIEFLVLHGNARNTPITITAAEFADGNPRVGFVGAADFLSDSLCFHDDRLVDGSALFGPAARLVVATPQEAIITVDLPNDGALAIGLYDMLGGLRARVVEGEFSAGEHRVRIPLDRLEAGVYLVQVVTAEGRSFVRVGK